jgi:hypothetical protein
VRLNPARMDLVERFEKLVADYNAGSINTETFFQELLKFTKTLFEEDARQSRNRTPSTAPSGRGLGRPSMAVLDMRLRSACCRSSQCFRRPQGWAVRRPHSGRSDRSLRCF